MAKALVAYFSASGVTKAAAEALAKAAGTDLYEICPEVPYTKADLDWTDKQSRSTLEMQDLNCRPLMANPAADVSPYDVIFLGFPIWWYREPSIVDTFLAARDYSGKRIVLFCTSGSSGFGDTARRIQEIVGPNAVVEEGRRLGGAVTQEELKLWAEELGI